MYRWLIYALVVAAFMAFLLAWGMLASIAK